LNDDPNLLSTQSAAEYTARIPLPCSGRQLSFGVIRLEFFSRSAGGRMRFKLRTVILIVVALFAVAAFLYLANVASQTIRNAYATWWVADMVVEHMKANHDQGRRIGTIFATITKHVSTVPVNRGNLMNCGIEFPSTGMLSLMIYGIGRRTESQTFVLFG
jgi:hypothetical protein